MLPLIRHATTITTICNVMIFASKMASFFTWQYTWRDNEQPIWSAPAKRSGDGALVES
jgi:hypothetical protein